jgi:hypothetical protein
MNNFQLAWLFVGLLFGLLLIIPFKRCLSTHNGIISVLIGSLIGIFSVSWAWVAVVVALVFFTAGLHKNHHKYTGMGVIQHDTTD